MESVALSLKQLRQRSGLSVRGLAASIGVDYSRYAYFEDPKRFKRPHLPMDLALKIAAILVDHGIAREEVLLLAGVDAVDAVAHELTAGQQEWLALWSDLTPEQRSLMFKLAAQMISRGGGLVPPPPASTLHQPQREYHAA